MPALDSDAISRAEYEPSNRILFVRLISGEWYAYLDVPPLTYRRLLAAGSKGRFFQDVVRDRYSFVRLDPLSQR